MSVPYTVSRWPSAAATTALWSVAAASIVFWGLRLSAPADGMASPSVVGQQPVSVDPAALARVLGAVSTSDAVVAAPEAASRFGLVGVVADAQQQGVALIAVDGQPPRPFRVGATVASGYVLQALDTRAATLGASVDSAPAFSLQLPTQPLAVMTPPPTLP